MSGSGGGRSDTTSGFGSAGDSNLCQIVKVVPLNSPDPNIIRTLKIGDVLSVQLEAVSSGQIVVVKDSQGRIAGSLTFTNFTLLISCIAKGFSYDAIVENLEGGSCIVRIQPSSGM